MKGKHDGSKTVAKKDCDNCDWLCDGSVWNHTCNVCRVWWCNISGFVAGNFENDPYKYRDGLFYCRNGKDSVCCDI